jgi:hypothetical protein
MGGRGSGQHNNHFCKYQVAEVLDDEGLPVYVTMQRAGESFVDMAWSRRHLIDNPFMAWLRTLEAPPQSRVLLGKAVQLPQRAAWMLMRFRRDEIARAAGSWPNVPDFALWPALSQGGRDHPRPVCRVRGDMVERFASVEEAARAAKTSRDAVEERVESGHPDDGGWSWWDASADNL